MTKSHTPKAPKPAKKPKVFKSDRSWAGKVILTGETVNKADQHGTPSYPPGWKSAQSFVDAEGYVNCYVDNRLVARYPTSETRSRLRKEESQNE